MSSFYLRLDASGLLRNFIPDAKSIVRAINFSSENFNFGMNRVNNSVSIFLPLAEQSQKFLLL